MFQSITFYVGEKTLGIYGEEFPLGALTTEILNITPAEYQVLNDSLKSAIEGMARYEKLSADELGLREMLSPDGVTKARKSALERLRSRYPGSGLHLWRDVYHALKDISDI